MYLRARRVQGLAGMHRMLNSTPRDDPADDAVLVFLGAGDGIRTRDIQLGSTISSAPAELRALTGLRCLRFVRVSPAGLLSLFRQICVQCAHDYM